MKLQFVTSSEKKFTVGNCNAINRLTTSIQLFVLLNNSHLISTYPHIVIVGAGIVGASLAYHLASQHARVTLIDKAMKPASDTTEKSFAWINVAHDVPEAYLHLRQQAISDWHRVENELKGQLKVDWSGALTWYESAAQTERIAHKLSHSGCSVRLVNHQEIRLLEPNLKDVPTQAMLAKDEGAIDPIPATEVFIKAARERGADIQLGNEVLSFMTHGTRVTGVVTANGKLSGDTVVLTAGTHTVSLCQSLGITLPVNTSPAILINFYNQRRFVNRIVSNPYMEIRAASNTLILGVEDYIDETTENNPYAIAQRTTEKIKKYWQGAEQIKLANVRVGKRPIPQDGLPIIGRTTPIGGLYVSVMHAGVTLAAIAGRLAAAEILTEQDDSLLSCYRPERLFSE